MKKFGKIRVLVLVISFLAFGTAGLGSNVRNLRCKAAVALADNRAITELLKEHPKDFHIVNDHLVVTTGHVTPLEYDTALEISKSLPEDRVLVLTPSLFGQGEIPAVDGVIYSKEAPITNISIKSVDANLGVQDDLVERIKRAKKDAQSTVRNIFNLNFFAQQFRTTVSPSGLLVSSGDAPYYRKKDERLNKIVKFLGLLPGQQRRVTIAVSVGSASMPLAFQTLKDGFGATHLIIQGQRNRSRINLDRLVDNLKYDREIAGYIFVSSYESVFVDARKYVFRDSTRASK